MSIHQAIAIVFLMTTVGQQFLATVGCIVGCLGGTAIACTAFDVQLGCYFRLGGCGGVRCRCYSRWPLSIRYLVRSCCCFVKVEVAETQKLLVTDNNATTYNSLGIDSDRKSPDINNTVTSYSSSDTDPEASVCTIATEFDESRHVLPRMCKSGYHKLRKQYTVYSWNTFTVGIFYALPAFQLVLSEQQILNSSGDQDKCYYNFKCAHPLGMLSAFNNIWSNVGYVLLGGLFFVIIWYRDGKYRRKRQANKEYIDNHGVPQFYGIYYGMAIALILEGFMSAFYHICPTNANFQFDTAFMFIIGGLFLVKIFQNRHPDINVNAFVAFFTFAIVIFMTLIGLYVDVNHPYAIRSAVFLVSLILVFIFLASFYNFHSWPDVKELKERMLSCGRCPRKKLRFFKLLLVAILNVFLAVACIVAHEVLDIATCVLVFFVANLLVFQVLYVLQKLCYCEKLTVLPLFLIVVIGFLWLCAFVFFMGLATTDWTLTPAESRNKNHDCALMGFYDYHDIWHLFSASAMFFSFSFLLTLDDGVQHTPRDQLRVF